MRVLELLNIQDASQALFVISSLGALIGALSGIMVYVLCVRRKQALNWFERDLLYQVEKEERISRENSMMSLQSIADDPKLTNEAYKRNPQNLPNDPSREGISRHLSECSCDEQIITPAGLPPSPLSLKNGESGIERLVAGKPFPIFIPSNTSVSSECGHERLSSTDSDDISGPYSAIETRGEIHLTLAYDAPKGLLTVGLLEAKNLRARVLSETADAYAKIRLLPDRGNVKQTHIHRETLNPVFNEDFVFQVPSNCQLAERTLEVLVYDHDTSSRHRGLGYAQIPLFSLNLSLEPLIIEQPIYRYGAEGRFKSPPIGELMVSLSYQPTSEKLTVIIIRAKNLPINDDSTTTIEPYVQVNIINDGKIIKRKKTSIRHDATSPVWSESLNFNIALDNVSQCALDLSVFKSNGEFLGRCEISQRMQSELFNRVLSGAGASAQWLPLSEPEKLTENIDTKS